MDVTRCRDLLTALTGKRQRTTTDIAAVAASLGVTPRRVWGLLRQLQLHGEAIAQSLPTRWDGRAKRLGSGTEAINEQAID